MKFSKSLFVVAALLVVVVTGHADERSSRLFFTPERIAILKSNIKSDSVTAWGWDSIIRRSERALQGNNFRDAEYLALAYTVTGKEQYAAHIKKMLTEQCSRKQWYVDHLLERKPAWRAELAMAHNSYQCAVAFDAIRSYLTAAERKDIAASLKRLAVEPAVEDWLNEPTRFHSLNSMGHNWWTACVCMAGLLSMSIEQEEPSVTQWIERIEEVLPQWFSFAGDALHFKPRSFDTNGGMYESLNYASYGISEALLFRTAWINTRKGKTPSPIPQLAQLENYFVNVCYPRTGILYDVNFGDSHKNVTAENPLLLLYAMGIGGRNTLWYLNQVQQGQHRDGWFACTPLGVTYRPDLRDAPDTPDYNTSEIFPDFGWATMRDSWHKDATMLAVKSGFTWNHSHADANSFVLFHKGVDIIKDAGNCNYGRTEYPDYFFQSEAHNVVRFDGQGQMREQQYEGSPLRGYLSDMLDGGSVKYILANGTGSMADKLSRNFRHFLWIEDVIYVVDDLKAHTPGRFEWLWHPGGEARRSGIDLDITNGNSAVTVRPIYPETLINGYVHDHPEKMKTYTHRGPTEDLQGEETYYSFEYPEITRRTKGLTAIFLKDSADDKDFPMTEKFGGENWIGLRVKYHGRVTEIYINLLADGRMMHRNSCIEMNGWQTDAYLLAFAYGEGASVESAEKSFIGYGSYLRRGGVSCFSSLSKLSMIDDRSHGSVDVTIDGQPVIDAALSVKGRPSSVTVNGGRAEKTLANGTLKIKIVKK